MAEAAGVAIVVVNYNSAGYVDDVVDSLEALSYPDWRLYVVDNASADGSPDRIAARLPASAVLRQASNVGFAAGVNIGLVAALAASPAYVLLLNPDTTFGPDLIDRLVEASDGRTLAVPKVLSAPGGVMAGHAGRFDWRRGLQVDTHDGELDGPAQDRTREVDTGSFSCMLVPAEAFRAVGLLDERLAFYYEDTDFVERTRRAGFRLVYEPAAVLYHAEGSSSGGRASAFATYYGTRNRPYVVKKYTERLDSAIFTAYFLSTRLLRCLQLAMTGEWSILKAVLRGVRDYYAGRMGMTYTAARLSGKIRTA